MLNYVGREKTCILHNFNNLDNEFVKVIFTTKSFIPVIQFIASFYKYGICEWKQKRNSLLVEDLWYNLSYGIVFGLLPMLIFEKVNLAKILIGRTSSVRCLAVSYLDIRQTKWYAWFKPIKQMFQQFICLILK